MRTQEHEATAPVAKEDTLRTRYIPATDPAVVAADEVDAGPRDSWLALAAIVVLGGVSGIAYYLGLVRPYRLDDYYSQPLLDLAKINGHTAQAANAWGLTWVVLFACYILAFRVCPPSTGVTLAFRRIALFLICGWAAFFSVNLLFMYPVGAADIFDQIFRARLLAHYNLNPFTTLPNNILGDPLQPYVAWKGDPSPYGPMWELLAGLTSWLAGSGLWENLILFKLLVMASYGANVALTYGILRLIRPDWALRGTLFFAWNPLVLFEVAGNGHNDSIVATFLLAAVYLLALGRNTGVIPALMAGALTKFVPVLLVPVAVAAIWRDRVRTPWRRVGVGTGLPARLKALSHFEVTSTLLIGGASALALAVMLYWPFWQGTGTIGALGRQSLFTASLPKIVLDMLVYDLGVRPEETAQTWVRYAALLLTALVTLGWTAYVFLSRYARTREERHALLDRTLVACYEIVFFYLAFASLWFQPWYLIWLVALTAPVARFTNANRTILFCIAGIANYFVWDFIWLWNRTAIRDTQVMSAIVIYTLPLFYTLYVLVSEFKVQSSKFKVASPQL
jgi:hypothetical protein